MNSPILEYKNIFIDFWTNEEESDILINNISIVFFYPDISNLDALITRLNRLQVFK